MAGDCTIDDMRNNLHVVQASYGLVEDRATDLTCSDARSLLLDNSWTGRGVIDPPANSGALGR